MNNSDSSMTVTQYENHFEHIIDICHLFLCALRDGVDNFATDLDRILKKESYTKNELPLVLIKNRFCLNEFEYICLMFGVAVDADELLGDIIQSSAGVRNPSFGLALHLYSLYYEITGEIFYSLQPDAPLSLLMKVHSDGTLSRRFHLRDEVFQYAAGKRISDNPRFTFRNRKNPGYVDLYFRQKKQITDILQNETEERILIVLSAGRGFGRRTLAAEACADAGYNLLAVERAGNSEGSEFEELVKTLACVCIMTKSIPIVSAEDTTATNLLKALPMQIKRIFLCSAGEENIPTEMFTVIKITLPPLTNSERQKVWESYGKGFDIDFAETAGRYRLSISQISAITSAVKLQKGDSQESTAELIFRGVGEHNKSSDFARIVYPAFGKNDLITDDKTKILLEQVCITFKHRARLYTDAGFGKLFPYGRGIGVLFYGVSGTGKTMAAQVLGRELELGVMAVDLSRIIDKYIGETEKHLSKIFDTASQNNCILFFDEADSLFSKRTEVSDSHDRNANAQVAHLLQKMEEYDGLSVLATNLIDNVDEAFKRRLPFIIEFKRPDAQLREILWRKFIPEEMPQDEIDYNYLSKNFELTPAVIKWTAFSAAVNAFSDGRRLSNEHIIRALKYEYEKTGAVFPDKDSDDIVL